MISWRFLYPLTLGLLGIALGLFWFWQAAKAPAPILESLSPDSLPKLQDTGRQAGLEEAIQASLRYLEGRQADETLPFGGGYVTVGRLRQTLKVFSALLAQDLTPTGWQDELSRRFTLYRLARPRDPWPLETLRRVRQKDRGQVLVTGYFLPMLPASLEQTEDFPYPIYAVPGNLVRVRLSDFDPQLPLRTLSGRVVGGCLVPYYTREEIDFGQSLEGVAQILAWLASPVDGLLLHIQGSGVLRLSDGTDHHVHFSGSNGHLYGSVGRWLIDKGLLSPKEADWQGIRAWVEAHPESLREALASNPRYIFFRWEDKGPIGSLGEVLTPRRSVALDQSIYPPGALCFLQTELPDSNPDFPPRPWQAFVCNQDEGNAIKGPRRLDLYLGEGDAAGQVAGRLKTPGELYLLVAKD